MLPDSVLQIIFNYVPYSRREVTCQKIRFCSSSSAARTSPLFWREVAMARSCSKKCMISGTDPAVSVTRPIVDPRWHMSCNSPRWF